MKPLFVFDLDSTVTKRELLPMIAQSAGLCDKMAELTEQAMRGELPFEESFEMRVGLLKAIPVSLARRIVENAPVNEKIAQFLRNHSSQCLILTGNLDVWVELLIARLGMQGRCECSRAQVSEDRLVGIKSILDKGEKAKHLPRPFVAIGDGENDAALLQEADIGIGFAGVRKLSTGVRKAADVIFEDEAALIRYLEGML